MRMKRFQYLYIVLVLGYLLLTLLTPVDPATTQRYHLSELQVRLVGMTVSVPLALIWLGALYGYTRFQAYSQAIAKEKEGKAFQEITRGIMLLALYLPFTSISSSLVRWMTLENPGLATYGVIGKSFVPVVFQLLAFSFLASGSAKLLKLLRPKVTIRYTDYAIAGMIFLASMFTYIVVARPFGGSVANNYALPAWLVVLTIVIPFLFAWYKGALKVYQIYLYRKHVVGNLYREMLKNLVAGLSTIIVSAILIQVLASVSASLTRLNFTPLLILVYVLIAIYAVGYGLLARGARQLKKIEEV